MSAPNPSKSFVLPDECIFGFPGVLDWACWSGAHALVTQRWQNEECLESWRTMIWYVLFHTVALWGALNQSSVVDKRMEMADNNCSLEDPFCSMGVYMLSAFQIGPKKLLDL